jgi:hypothetical protein
MMVLSVDGLPPPPRPAVSDRINACMNECMNA